MGACQRTKCRPMHAKCGATPQLTRIVLVPICVGDELEALQERVDVDVGSLLGLVGLVWIIVFD